MPASPGTFSTHSKPQSFGNTAALLRHQGWEEVKTLGIGARGPVILIKRQSRTGDAGRARHSALKRSSHQEVCALKALSQCKHIVALEEHFSSPSAHDMVWARLEWLDGGTLRGFLRGSRDRRTAGTISEDVNRFIIGQIIEGLVELHRHGWMHRDIKAENIGISKPTTSSKGRLECHVKLLDFDSAVQIPSPPIRLTEIIGTVENMAPEVFGGCYDEKADCWSLGVVAFEMLFGYRPFNDACIEQVEEMVRNWEQYLIIPYDASEVASSFLHKLFTGSDDRSSSAQAAAHSWLHGAKNSISIELAAAAVADALEAQESSSAGPFGSLNVNPFASHARSSTLSSPSSPEDAAESKVSRWAKLSGRPKKLEQRTIAAAAAAAMASPSSPVYQSDGGDGDILRRMRSSLAEWSAPSLGSIFDRRPDGSRSSVSAHVDGPSPMGLLGNEPLPQDCPLSRTSSSCSALARASSNESVAGRAGQEMDNVALCGQESEEVDENDPLEYLKSVRARTFTIVQAAENAAAASMAAAQSIMAARSATASLSSFDSSFTAAARPGRQAVPPNTIEPELSVSHAATEPALQAPGSESELTHLNESRERIRRLLSNFPNGPTADSITTPLAPSQDDGRAAQASLSSPMEPESEPHSLSSPPVTSFEDAPEELSSPNSWLVKQRRRTSSLLERLRSSSEIADAGKPHTATPHAGAVGFQSQGVHGSSSRPISRTHPKEFSQDYMAPAAPLRPERPVCVWV